MTISTRLTSRAKKDSVVIQCVMRMTAVTQGVVVGDGTAEGRLLTEAASAIRVWYQLPPRTWSSGACGLFVEIEEKPKVFPKTPRATLRYGGIRTGRIFRTLQPGAYHRGWLFVRPLRCG